MVDITNEIFASGAVNQRGMIERSVSDTADTIADLGGGIAQNMARPEKIRRVDGSSQSRHVALPYVWDSEESDRNVDSSDTDGGSDNENEEFSDDEFSDDGLSDGEFADDEFAEEDAKELNEETLFQLQRMDPNVKSLVARRISENISGDAAGRCLGDTCILQKLTIEGQSMSWKGDPRALEWFSKLCTGIARNRSIGHLSLGECNLDGAPSVIRTLSPFLELNSNLHSLEIISCNIGDEITRLLSSALARRCSKSTLRRINLEANLIGDESGAELVDALKGYDDLSELSLGDNKIGKKSCDALSNLLSSPNCNVKELNLENNWIGDDGIASFSKAMANSTSLKELSLSFNCNITQAGWQRLSTCLHGSNSALETLDLSSTNIADEGAIALGSSLFKNKTLRTLNLYDLSSNGMPLITGIGWRGFFACLQNQESALEQIDLRYSSIDDGGLSALTNALAKNSTVKMLDLSHNAHITATGWRSFCACLKYPNVAIEELYICNNNITDREMAHLAQSLAGNCALKTLNLEANSSITNSGWAPFSHLLCNKSSIDDISNSNHTLQYLGDSTVPAELDALLQSNEHGNKKDVAREKILKYYFQNGETDMQKLLDMKLSVLPHAISWICENDAGIFLLYELLTKLPSLFSSVDKTKDSGGKRKRDT